MSLHSDLQWHSSQPVVSFDRAQSISRLDCFSSAQMTRVHPVPALLPLGRRDQVLQVLLSKKGGEPLFFQPRADSVTRHAKRAFVRPPLDCNVITHTGTIAVCGHQGMS